MKSNTENYKTVRASVRMTVSEYERLKRDADFAGLTPSEFIRRRIFGRPIIANVDLIMVKELRRLGGLLKHSLVVSDGAYRQEVSTAMEAVKQFIVRLSNDIQKN